MKKKWIIIGVTLLIIGMISVNVFKSKASTSVSVKTTTMKEETMKETVITPGTLRLAKEQSVYVQPEHGKVEEVFIKEGDKVEKGDQLLRYENKQLELEQKQNELQIRSANLEIENLREKHEKLDKELEKDTENEMLQEEHDQIKVQQQQADLDLEQALLEKEMLNEQMDELIVTSELKGTVVTVNEEVITATDQMGEKPLLKIGSLNHIHVEGTISEYDTLKISEGQSVKLTSDAVPDQEWKGKVKFIADLPEETTEWQGENGTQGVTYPITVKVEDEIKLKPGFQMLIEIETSKEKKQTLPLNAIKQEDEDNYVYVVKGDKAVRVDVSVGSVNTEKIEIKDGLTKEDAVIVDPPSDLTDGMEVTVK